MELFHIDESGFTGHDLLNPDQRFQGASAICISDDEAAALIKEFFPRVQAAELKYQSLSKRQRYHQPLIELQRSVLSRFKCTTCVADKRYLLCLIFMDYAVEPFYYARGIDFYKDGNAHSLASLLYRVGPVLLGEGVFDRILAAFQHAVKQKSIRANTELIEAVRASRWQELPEALGPLANADSDCLDAICVQGVSTDGAPVILQALISRMEVQSSGPYLARHDRSDNLATYHQALLRYINHDKVATFKNSEITSLTFPLKLRGVEQVDSKQSPAIQIADVMVGAAVESANTLTGQRQGALSPRQVLSLYRDEQLIHYLPSLDFAEQKRFREGAQSSEMIEYFARHFGG